MFQLTRKIIALLDRGDRIKAGLLLFPMLVAAIVDVIGIAFVMPFIVMVADPGAIQAHQKLLYFYQLSHASSPHRFLILLGIVLFFVLVIANALGALNNWFMWKFMGAQESKISSRLLEKYLSHPYEFFLNQNTSALMKNIITETEVVSHGIIMYSMQLLTKLFAVFFIVLLLMIVNFKLAVFLSVIMGSVYAVIYAFIRKRLGRISIDMTTSQEARFQLLNESFGGVKEIKFLKLSRFFLNQFKESTEKYTSSKARLQIISTMPKYILESIAFGGVFLIVVYMLAAQHSTATILPILGVYVFAGYRLLPALQTIFMILSSLKGGFASLDLVSHDLLTSLTINQENSMPSNKLIMQKTLQLNAIQFSYPNATCPVFSNFHFVVQANTTIGLVGTTGAGKTTLIDIILGVLSHQSGALVVDNVVINGDNLSHWQANIGYVPQQIFLLDNTIASNIAFGIEKENIDYAAVERAARIANLHDFIVSELPLQYQTVVGERGVRLSGGQRQRIGIARALYRDPGVLILDEATSSLDGITELAIMDAIHNLARKKTIIIIAHRLTTLKECDVIYIMEKGKIVDKGKYESLMSVNLEFQKMANLE
ncbi:MAG: ABC transporter ATP-binding protein [Pseudomonadota bacterium]